MCFYSRNSAVNLAAWEDSLTWWCICSIIFTSWRISGRHMGLYSSNLSRLTCELGKPLDDWSDWSIPTNHRTGYIICRLNWELKIFMNKAFSDVTVNYNCFLVFQFDDLVQSCTSEENGIHYIFSLFRFFFTIVCLEIFKD